MDKKEQQAIDFLRSMERDDLLSLGFSGGKDSVVILDLAERAGIKYNAIYANTTVDPPGTISFIKRHYPQVRIIHPEKSFFQLVEEKGLPSRLRRFCCERLKERYGIGKRSIEGMRAVETVFRKDKGELIILSQKIIGCAKDFDIEEKRNDYLNKERCNL